MDAISFALARKALPQVPTGRGKRLLLADHFTNLDSWAAGQLPNTGSANVGTWTVSGGEVSSPAGESTDQILLADAASTFRRGSIEMLYHFATGKSWAGFYVRGGVDGSNDRNALLVLFFPTNKVSLWESPAGFLSKKQEITMSGSDVTFADGEPAALRLDVRDTEIDVIVNGRLVTTFDNTVIADYPSGQMGIVTDKANSYTFSEVSIAETREAGVLAIGSSITNGFGVTTAPPALFEADMLTANTPVSVVNAGVGGDTTTGMETRAQAAIDKWSPDVVLIEASINDAKVTAPVAIATTLSNISSMVDMARTAGATPVVWTSPPIDPSISTADWTSASWVQIRQMNHQVRIWCEENNVVLSDVFRAFDNDLALIQADKLHPNDSGAQKISDTWAATFAR